MFLKSFYCLLLSWPLLACSMEEESSEVLSMTPKFEFEKELEPLGTPEEEEAFIRELDNAFAQMDSKGWQNNKHNWFLSLFEKKSEKTASELKLLNEPELVMTNGTSEMTPEFFSSLPAEIQHTLMAVAGVGCGAVAAGAGCVMALPSAAIAGSAAGVGLVTFGILEAHKHKEEISNFLLMHHWNKYF